MATAKSGTTKIDKTSATATTRETTQAGKKRASPPADKKLAATKPAAKKADARKTVAAASSSSREPAGETSAPSKSSARDAGTQQAAKPGSTKKSTTTKPEKTTGVAGRITPQQALANTRALLEARKGHARQPQPWQKLDQQAGPADKTGYQSPEAADKAEQLHEGESRMQAIQGSISATDRTNQGKRDAR